MFVYKREDSGSFIVFHYRPDGSIAVASRHVNRSDALRRVNYLNGGTGSTPPAQTANADCGNE